MNALLFSLILVAAAGEPAKVTGDAPDGPVRSQVLTAEFSKVLADAIAADKAAGRKPPNGWDKPTFVPNMLKQYETKYAGLLQTSAEQEKDFAAGNFDDRGNGERMKKTVGILRDFGLKAWPNEYLADELAAGRLRGVRLEVASRMFASHIARLIERIKIPPPDPASPPTVTLILDGRTILTVPQTQTLLPGRVEVVIDGKKAALLGVPVSAVSNAVKRIGATGKPIGELLVELPDGKKVRLETIAEIRPLAASTKPD